MLIEKREERCFLRSDLPNHVRKRATPLFLVQYLSSLDRQVEGELCAPEIIRVVRVTHIHGHDKLLPLPSLPHLAHPHFPALT